MKKLIVVSLFIFAFLLAACGASPQAAPSDQEESPASQEEAPVGPEATAEEAVQDAEDEVDQEDAEGAEAASAEREDPELSDLPIGDGYVSNEPRVGYVWSCIQEFSDNAGGASATGEWYHEGSGTWDFNSKPVVDGSVSWDYEFTMTVEGDTRIIEANGLPFHVTGEYPIDSSDDAYQYDANPHSVEAQSYHVELPANPTMLANPNCVGGEVGIATSGVAINNALDAPGRDAVSTEIQDQCQGHPHSGGVYHYHGYSLCLEDQDASGHSALIGWAMDGFGIYGVYGENGEVLTNEDLDECHGHIHEIDWDGETVEMYHYHATFEYPYTVGCFRGEDVTFTDVIQAIQSDDSSSGPQGGSQGGGNQGGGNQGGGNQGGGNQGGGGNSGP